jgi:hypothetical protein
VTILIGGKGIKARFPFSNASLQFLKRSPVYLYLWIMNWHGVGVSLRRGRTVWSERLGGSWTLRQ